MNFRVETLYNRIRLETSKAKMKQRSATKNKQKLTGNNYLGEVIRVRLSRFNLDITSERSFPKVTQ